MSDALLVSPAAVRDAGGITLRAPASKSLALRGLMVAAAGRGGVLRGLADPLADDVLFFLRALETLGFPCERSPGRGWVVVKTRGVGSAPLVTPSEPVVARPESVTVDAGEGGAPARFLLALAALDSRPVTVEGRGRLPERPMGPLLAALMEGGAMIQGGPGLPATVRGPVAFDRPVTVSTNASSQFLSALLMIAPAVAGGLSVRGGQAPVSRPYLDLTKHVMGVFGVEVDDQLRCRGQYTHAEITVEADWSGATALLAAAPFLGCPVHVPGIRGDSLQPDGAFLDVLMRLGLHVAVRDDGVVASGAVRRGGRFPMGDLPDATPALVALAALAPEPIEITGIAHLRLKESDRITALGELARAVGLEVAVSQDRLLIRGGPISRVEAGAPPVFAVTRGDHRVAMAAALLGLRRPVRVDDPGCVTKSFPGFFAQWPGVDSGLAAPPGGGNIR